MDPTPSTNAIMPKVSCVVLNWNGWADTLACLASLATQNWPALEVIVVDNGSTDDSVTRIREAFPQITLLEAGGNLGFSRGNNVGIRHAMQRGAHYVWLLNNDTVAPPDTCEKLVRKAQSEPRAGLIGSVLHYMHAPDQVQAWGGGRVNALLGISEHFTAPATFGRDGYMTFASVFIPREVIERVGLMYEGAFMYWEDSDYAFRVTAAGYGLAVAEDTRILHKEGASNIPRTPRTDRYATTSGLHFLKRHSPAPWFSMPFFVAMRCLNRLARGRWPNVRAVLQGVADYRKNGA